MKKIVCGIATCDEAADVLVLTPILLKEFEIPRCERHLSKHDNYRMVK